MRRCFKRAKSSQLKTSISRNALLKKKKKQQQRGKYQKKHLKELNFVTSEK